MNLKRTILCKKNGNRNILLHKNRYFNKNAPEYYEKKIILPMQNKFLNNNMAACGFKVHKKMGSRISEF